MDLKNNFITNQLLQNYHFIFDVYAITLIKQFIIYTSDTVNEYALVLLFSI